MLSPKNRPKKPPKSANKLVQVYNLTSVKPKTLECRGMKYCNAVVFGEPLLGESLLEVNFQVASIQFGK